MSYNGDVTLFYQKRDGNKAIEPLSIPLIETKSKSKVAGTIPKYLLGIGYRISSSAKLTSAMTRQLSRKGYFVEYSYHHFNGGDAAVIDPNGNRLGTHHSDDKFIISPEEKNLHRNRAK